MHAKFLLRVDPLSGAPTDSVWPWSPALADRNDMIEVTPAVADEVMAYTTLRHKARAGGLLRGIKKPDDAADVSAAVRAILSRHLGKKFDGAQTITASPVGSDVPNIDTVEAAAADDNAPLAKLEDMTAKELNALCRELGIRTNLPMDEKIAAIKKARAAVTGAAAPPAEGLNNDSGQSPAAGA